MTDGNAAQTRVITEQMAEATISKVTRAEWVSFGAFGLNILTLAFGLGVVWADVQDHEARLAKQETKIDMIVPRLERIDANVAFLAERAREDRERIR